MAKFQFLMTKDKRNDYSMTGGSMTDVQGLVSKKWPGVFLAEILVFSTLFLIVITFIMSLAYSSVKMANRHNSKITSMSIAEAGVNYYLWHLAHNNTDYCDGNTCEGEAPYGPYTHDYKDGSGRILGSYDLYITPPHAGDAAVEVKSVGRISESGTKRTVVAKLGMPSFTKYTLLVNDSEIWVGSGERVDGSLLVNNSGVKNDGIIAGDTYSTVSRYNSSMGHGNNLLGINGTGVFMGGKYFPVPPIDFNQVNVDMLQVRNDARDSGKGHYYDNSGSNGYHIILGHNNYTLKRVTGYSSNKNNANHLSITSETTIGTYSYPEKGVIFCEDNVWVEGRINNDKITIFAADPEASGTNRKRIIIPNSILYSYYDGRDKIGLITQTDILLPRNSPFNMEIDAAMIARYGEIKIFDYPYEHKGNIKIYGSMAHNTGLIWTYMYSDNRWSGYQTTQTVIDSHNILQPPPKFPLTGSYSILNWREE